MNIAQFNSFLKSFFPYHQLPLILEMMAIIFYNLPTPHKYICIGFWEPYSIIQSLLSDHVSHSYSRSIDWSIHSPRMVSRSPETMVVVNKVSVDSLFKSKILPNSSIILSKVCLDYPTSKGSLSPSMEYALLNSLLAPYRDEIVKLGEPRFCNLFNHPKAHTVMSPKRFIQEYIPFAGQLEWNPHKIYANYVAACKSVKRLAVSREEFDGLFQEAICQPLHPM